MEDPSEDDFQYGKSTRESGQKVMMGNLCRMSECSSCPGMLWVFGPTLSYGSQDTKSPFRIDNVFSQSVDSVADLSRTQCRIG